MDDAVMDLEKARRVYSTISGQYLIAPNGNRDDFCIDASFLTLEEIEAIAYLARHAKSEMESIERV